MKLLNILIVICLFSYGFVYLDGDEQKNSIVFWNEDEKLEALDFQGEVNDSVKTYGYSINPDAVSFIGYDIEYIELNGKLDVKIQTTFDRTKSFFKNKLTPYILEHEQCHFDIAEIHARKMRKGLIELKRRNINDELLFDKTIDSLMVVNKQVNREFDNDTFHGTILASQEEWVLKIEKEINELSDFSYRNSY
jgi:hypothetical protein